MVHLNRGHKLLLGFACCCPHDDFFLYHGSTVRTFMGHMMRARVTRKVCSHEWALMWMWVFSLHLQLILFHASASSESLLTRWGLRITIGLQHSPRKLMNVLRMGFIITLPHEPAMCLNRFSILHKEAVKDVRRARRFHKVDWSASFCLSPVLRDSISVKKREDGGNRKGWSCSNCQAETTESGIKKECHSHGIGLW